MPDSAVRKPDPAAKKPAPEKSAEMQPAGKKPVEGSKPHARDLRGSIPEVAPAQDEALRGLLAAHRKWPLGDGRSEEHTSELQTLMRLSYAVFCLKKRKS